ncbi:interferon-induced protein 44-like isoform X3 [Ostrea edulis]|uniref:interferon-induced protein 44-like isoform X3 n=1 Tax=Ostrea edulis TaxID=37623 RepID=UPI0024AEE5AC|nr:interferon-induced protein 44-like isoform X3 [Ostrea edulis]
MEDKKETSPDMLLQPWHEMDDYEWNETVIYRIFREETSPDMLLQPWHEMDDYEWNETLDVYKVKGRRTFRHLRFRMIDCRGLEEDQSINSRDVEAILDGHVMDGYVFNQGTPINKDNSKFRKDPSIGDRVHCVLFVVDGSNPPEITMSQNVEKQVKELQELMNGRKIPQLILLTKLDTMVTVKEDLSKVFHSRSVLEMRDKVAMSFGLPSYTVLPMQNLANSRTVSTEIKMLTLYNIRQILRAADDYLENFEDEILADTYMGAQVKTH